MATRLVEAYNPEWPTWFALIAGFASRTLTEAGVAHTVHHVGSTSIPGMTAKPIIDLDIVIAPGLFDATRRALQTIGYVHEGELGIPGRHAFDRRGPVCGDGDIRGGSTLPRHHLYVCMEDCQALREHLAFRDFLRVRPGWVEQLSRLKLSLCERYGDDRQAYIDGKDAMVRRITRCALDQDRAGVPCDRGTADGRSASASCDSPNEPTSCSS